MKQLELMLKLHSLPDKKPEFLIYINNKEIKNFTFISEYADDDLNLCVVKQELNNIGNHNFKIQFLNKLDTDLLVDKSRDIFVDLAIEIYSVKIDDVDITHEARSTGIYQNINSLNDETFGYMHTNGTLTFNFITPIFLYKRNISLIK